MSATAENPPGGTFPLAGRPVARIGYGAMQLSGPGGQPAPARDDAIAVLRRAVQRGVNHIDTAQFYGPDIANELIRAALSPYPEDLTIVTKVGAQETEAGGLVAAQRPEELRAGVEANLRGLGIERVDVVNLRRMDTKPGVVARGDQVVDLDSQLAELVALRDAGKIGAVGLSHVSLEQLGHALPVGIVCVQNAYSLLDRSGEPLLELCCGHDIAWAPFFPLGSAFPGIAKLTDHPAVRAAASALSATPAQVGLAWLLAHAPNVLVIPGTGSVAHLDENLATAGVRLDVETMAVLDGLATPQ